MTQSITAPSISRSQARASVWAFLDVGANPNADTAPGLTSPTGLRLDTVSADRLIRRGIPSRVVSPLGEFLGLAKGTLAAYLDLDRSTASRRAAKDQVLPTHAAEGVVRLLEIDQMACDTFESEADASRWLRQPHPMLDGETPLETAKTGYGAQRVKDILLAIQYGGVV